MRNKKLPPPLVNSEQSPAPPARPVTEYDTAKSIRVIENLLTQALDPEQAVTPDQLKDMMEMFITLMHLRKVTGDFWMNTISRCTRGIELAAQISAEARLSRTPDLDPAVVKMIEGAIELSVQEIRALRVRLFELLGQLRQCPNDGDRVH